MGSLAARAVSSVHAITGASRHSRGAGVFLGGRPFSLNWSKWRGTGALPRAAVPAAVRPVVATYASASASQRPPSPYPVYTSHTVYKGKAALEIVPVSPVFRAQMSGALVVEREGTLLLKFAPAIEKRKYNWDKKQLFALSVVECGAVVDLGPTERLEFFHDPNMGTPNLEGKVRKQLTVEPLRPDTGGVGSFYVKLYVRDDTQHIEESIGIPISKAELAVIRTLAQYTIPHLLGFDVLTNPGLAEYATITKEEASQGSSPEWS